MKEQFLSPQILFGPEIERVRAELRAGRPVSAIANSLHAQGVRALQLVVIFKEVTGASLSDLKAFGQWWGPDGVTDVRAFDNWASEVLVKTSARR